MEVQPVLFQWGSTWMCSLECVLFDFELCKSSTRFEVSNVKSFAFKKEFFKLSTSRFRSSHPSANEPAKLVTIWMLRPLLGLLLFINEILILNSRSSPGDWSFNFQLAGIFWHLFTIQALWHPSSLASTLASILFSIHTQTSTLTSIRFSSASDAKMGTFRMASGAFDFWHTVFGLFQRENCRFCDQQTAIKFTLWISLSSWKFQPAALQALQWQPASCFFGFLLRIDRRWSFDEEGDRKVTGRSVEKLDEFGFIWIQFLFWLWGLIFKVPFSKSSPAVGSVRKFEYSHDHVSRMSRGSSLSDLKNHCIRMIRLFECILPVRSLGAAGSPSSLLNVVLVNRMAL